MEEEIILVDKPKGMTSFGVVARIRRRLSILKGKKREKVGHAGTLDPFATGLLLVLVGKGTKKAENFLKLNKEYEAVIRLGARSSTGDPEGEISENDEANLIEREKVEKVVRSFEGEIWQKVPRFSAVKIQGERAYRLARKGMDLEMPRRKVKIGEIKILDYSWPELKIYCKVSSGTYIRSLGEDIGEALGVGGYLTELRRTRIGEFKIDDAEKLEILEKRLDEIIAERKK